jgi:hypothetical protein
MPRVQFNDVTPPDKRSIRNIPIPNGGKRKAPTVIRPVEPAPKAEPAPFSTPPSNTSSNFNYKIPETPENKITNSYEDYYPNKKVTKPQSNVFNNSSPDNKKSRRKKFIFGGIIVVLIAAFIVSMMTVFASATVSIKPKSQSVDVDMKITGVSERENNTVRYEVVKLSQSKTVSVPATGEEAVELKASGKIVIYNNFSTDPQRLIVRTRFESSDGLIFRIPESVVVPGKTIKNGVETPGSTEVEIFADEAGEKYNIKKSDFTIPGFKSDANRYKNFYARASTNMTGGFIGKRKTVAAADKQTALQNIDSEVNDELSKNLQSKVPEGLVLLPGSVIFKSKELTPKEETSSVSIGKEITAYAVMLNKQDLSDAITNEYISKSVDWNNIKSIVNDFSSLKVSNLPDNLDANGKITPQITGKADILADIDANVIAQRLLGAPKGDASKLTSEFPGIYNITVAIRPMWKQSFPENPSKIYVQTTSGH